MHERKYKLVDIAKVEEVKYTDEYVYDVVMFEPESPYFVANDILVHNSCYFKTHTTNVDMADKVGKAVEFKVNKSFPAFMEDSFLCNKNHNMYMSAEQEIVADNSIFVKPKHYLMHLVRNDGFAVNKMKVMGLALKKTTVPKAIKIVLTKFIEELLLDRDWDDISRDLVDYRKEVKYLPDIKDIGLPKGVNKVEEYTKAYIADKGTRLPGHVAASIFWNYCIKNYDDKESFEITSGMKIKVYYLKKKFGRFKSIAMPTDARFVPKWFRKHFEHLIDREAQAQRLIENTIRTILWAVDLKMPTGKSLLFDELVEY